MIPALLVEWVIFIIGLEALHDGKGLRVCMTSQEDHKKSLMFNVYLMFNVSR